MCEEAQGPRARRAVEERKARRPDDRHRSCAWSELQARIVREGRPTTSCEQDPCVVEEREDWRHPLVLRCPRRTNDAGWICHRRRVHTKARQRDALVRNEKANGVARLVR